MLYWTAADCGFPGWAVMRAKGDTAHCKPELIFRYFLSECEIKCQNLWFYEETVWTWTCCLGIKCSLLLLEKLTNEHWLCTGVREAFYRRSKGTWQPLQQKTPELLIQRYFPHSTWCILNIYNIFRGWFDLSPSILYYYLMHLKSAASCKTVWILSTYTDLYNN